MQINNFYAENWINTHEATCKYDLTNTCVGVMDVNELLSISENSDECLDDIMHLKLSYGKVFGSQRLRKNICSLYENAGDENIVVTHGAICANSLVFLSILEPDDEVIVYLPIYQQHYSIPKSIGANVKKIYLNDENGWMPDFDELRKTINDKTKLICINNPNNPTGFYWDKECLSELAKIASKTGTYILADEVYRGLNHNGNPFGKSIFDIYERGISTSSMSKAFSLPGLRLGWVCAPCEITEKINVQRNYHVISVGLVNDYLASVALENKDKIVGRNVEICKSSLNILDNWINNSKHFTYIRPKSGTTAFLKYDKKVNSEVLCEKFQQDTGVMILPGKTMEYEGRLRIGYAYDINEVISALTLLDTKIEMY